MQPLRLALQLCCWLAALAAGQAAAQSPKRVALLIGNADDQVEAKLKNPVRDAELLVGVLRDKLKFTDVRIERNLGVTGMDRAIDAFIEHARGAESVVFYYSGHGMKRAAKDRRNFLLPVDASVGRPGSADVERRAIDAQRLRDRLRDLGAKVTLLVLDACRNGPGGSKSGDKSLARMGGSNQLLVAYATEEDQVAADGSGSNSPYAEALAQALQRPEPLLQQLDWVADEVEKMVPGQKPTRDGNLRATAWLGNPFAPVTPDNRAQIEDEAWALCRSAGSSSVACEDYLSTYPEGRYVSVARTRSRDLLAARPIPPRPDLSPNPAPPTPGPAQGVSAGKVIQDCDVCPKLVMIPAGNFQMGSTDGHTSESPVREVRVAEFFMGQTEVSQGQWKTLMGNNPSGFKDCGDDCPVEKVGWEDAQAYVKKLSERTGKTYRLPSEAEWEYAARAGSRTRWSFGDEESQLVEYAWFNGNSTGRTQRVANRKPNAWGLHDMHGNVWEWVQDIWHDNYHGAPTDTSAWTTGGEMRLSVSSEEVRSTRFRGFYARPSAIAARQASRTHSLASESPGLFNLEPQCHPHYTHFQCA